MSTEPVSRADAIAHAIETRLAVILVEDGYASNIGQTVYRGRRPVDVADMPAAVLIEEEDEIADQAGQSVVVRLPYTVHGLATCTPATAAEVAHQLVRDLKCCLFDPAWQRGLVEQKLIDPKYGVRYAGRVIAPREDGSNVIEVAVRLHVWYAEDLTNP